MVVSFSSCHTYQYCYLTWLIEFFKNIKSGRLFSSLIAMIRSTNSFIFLFGVIQLFLHISIHYVYSKELEEECYLFTMDGSIEWTVFAAFMLLANWIKMNHIYLLFLHHYIHLKIFSSWSLKFESIEEVVDCKSSMWSFTNKSGNMFSYMMFSSVSFLISSCSSSSWSITSLLSWKLC